MRCSTVSRTSSDAAPPPARTSRTQGSTQRSAPMRPSTKPPTIATDSPAAMYSSATWGPNRPHNRTSATSLTMGEAMRKVKVTPSGMPASTKPMKSGTAEQLQNGVMTPNPAAPSVPATVPRPASADRTRSGGK